MSWAVWAAGNATAKRDYQSAMLLGYNIGPKWTLLAGYRYLFWIIAAEALCINVVTSAALIGLTYTFK
jgi:hypothetical protein